MNLMSFLKRGAKHAPTEAERAQAAINSAAEKTREQWLDALMVDQTRAWMSLGEHQPEVIYGMVTLLALAGYCEGHEVGDDSSPNLRVIRGAMSAAAQCAEGKRALTVDDARAFSSAATRAADIIRSCSIDSIVYAATKMRGAVGLQA